MTAFLLYLNLLWRYFRRINELTLQIQLLTLLCCSSYPLIPLMIAKSIVPCPPRPYLQHRLYWWTSVRTWMKEDKSSSVWRSSITLPNCLFGASSAQQADVHSYIINLIFFSTSFHGRFGYQETLINRLKSNEMILPRYILGNTENSYRALVWNNLLI